MFGFSVQVLVPFVILIKKYNKWLIFGLLSYMIITNSLFRIWYQNKHSTKIYITWSLINDINSWIVIPCIIIRVYNVKAINTKWMLINSVLIITALIIDSIVFYGLVPKSKANICYIVRGMIFMIPIWMYIKYAHYKHIFHVITYNFLQVMLSDFTIIFGYITQYLHPDKYHRELYIISFNIAFLVGRYIINKIIDILSTNNYEDTNDGCKNILSDYQSDSIDTFEEPLITYKKDKTTLILLTFIFSYWKENMNATAVLSRNLFDIHLVLLLITYIINKIITYLHILNKIKCCQLSNNNYKKNIVMFQLNIFASLSSIIMAIIVNIQLYAYHIVTFESFRIRMIIVAIFMMITFLHIMVASFLLKKYFKYKHTSMLKIIYNDKFIILAMMMYYFTHLNFNVNYTY